MFITPQYAQNIVNEMKNSIHRDINIMDENGVILASTNPARQGALHQGAVRVLREGLPSLIIKEDDPAAGVLQGINLSVSLGGDRLGVIGITGRPEEVAVFGEIIKRMAELMVENARQAEQYDLLEKTKRLFVENWLFSDAPNWAELEIRGRLLGLDINEPYTVALLETAWDNQSGYSRSEDLAKMHNGLILRMIQNSLKDDEHHYCATIRSKIIVLLYRMERSEAYERVAHICRNIESYYGLIVSGGISGASQNPEDIRRCYLEAQAANSVASNSGTEKTAGSRVVFYDQVSLEFIVRSIPRSIRQDLHKLIFASCTPQEKEEFLQTIRLYFEQEGDIQRCADKIFVHRNTFQYHISQLKKKTGYNLRSPKDAVLLYLAAQAEG